MAHDDLDFEEDPDTGEKYVRLSEKDAVAQREKARKADELAAAAMERDAAQRELAFLKAGIDPDSPVGKLFVKGYDGELTVDAIRAAATEIPGLVGATTPPSEGEPTPEQQAAAEAEARQMAERGALARGTSGAGEPPARDPRELAIEAVQKARQAGLSEENALSAGLNELVGAAMAGDRRVRLPSFGDRGE